MYNYRHTWKTYTYLLVWQTYWQIVEGGGGPTFDDFPSAAQRVIKHVCKYQKKYWSWGGLSRRRIGARAANELIQIRHAIVRDGRVKFFMHRFRDFVFGARVKKNAGGGCPMGIRFYRQPRFKRKCGRPDCVTFKHHHYALRVFFFDLFFLRQSQKDFLKGFIINIHQ